MADQFHWVATTGGPHILVPVEYLSMWRGVEGWVDNGPEDASDYARACRITNYLGKIRSEAGCAVVVLSGDVGHIAWFPGSGDEIGVLVQLLACDSDEALLALLKVWQSTPQNNRPYEETLDFETGPSGAIQLLDSTEGGKFPITGLTISLPPGRHKMQAEYLETDTCVAVFREIRAWAS